jgi:protein gp37
MKNSRISWTDHTFNPWWGCIEVSDACDHCYAREWAKRCGFTHLWGKDHQLREFGDKHWNEPLKWNREAQAAGEPADVFCASMADVFEVHPIAESIRPRLQNTIAATQWLRWLLLTKRADAIRRHVHTFLALRNVLMGVTVENQEATRRINEHVRWLSVEPMLSRIRLRETAYLHSIRWVVIGGEARPGGKGRPTQLDWIKELSEECQSNGIGLHVKQTGDWLARELGLENQSGKDPKEWPGWMQIQEPAPVRI